MPLLVDRFHVGNDERIIRELAQATEYPASWREEVSRRLVGHQPVYEITNVARYMDTHGNDYRSWNDFPNVRRLHEAYWMEWVTGQELHLMNGCDPPDRVATLIVQSTDISVSVFAYGLWRNEVKPILAWKMEWDEGELTIIHAESYNAGHLFFPQFEEMGFREYAIHNNRGVFADWKTYEETFSNILEIAHRSLSDSSLETATVTEELYEMSLGEGYRKAPMEAEVLQNKLLQIAAAVDWIVIDYMEKAILHRVLMAHSLLSCKNVSTDVEHPPRALSDRHRKRTGRPLVSFKTISISVMGRSRRGVQNPGSGSSPSLHIVRGHFKTYTKERPLLGRHSGTFWWEAALRGDSAQGIVVKDYEMKAPSE